MRCSSWLVSVASRSRRLAAVSLVAAAVAVPAPALSAGSAGRGPAAAPVLRWHPCEGGFFCATLRVPLDYRRPDGRLISIAVIEHRAASRRPAGSLLFNSGGPGGGNVAFMPLLYRLFPAQIRARFTIVTFDPRGTGLSTAVRCFPTARAELRFFAGLPAFPVGRAQQRQWADRYAALGRRCQRTSGWLLPHLSTADVARDMDLLRRALGERQINYLAISYGSYLGATYANLFPGRVRAMVLDANIDPVAWATEAGGAGSLSLRLHSPAGTVATLHAFLDLCGRAGPARCAFAAGSAAATRAKYRVLLRRLRSHPVTIGHPPAVYTYATTVNIVDTNLAVAVARPGVAPGWRATAALAQRLWAASTPGHLATAPAASAPAPRLAHPGTPSTAAAYRGLEQGIAITCSDSPNPHTVRAYLAEAARAGARWGGTGLDWVWTDEPCASWPAMADDRYTGPWNRPTAHPILLVATTYDPALPYRDSLAMAHDLARARLLTVAGYGHTTYLNPSACAYAYETAYLLRGALPPRGTVCHQNQAPFG